jgi:hypothetical protein
MKFDYSRPRATADRLIERFGAAAMIHRLPDLSGGGESNPDEGPQYPWEVEPDEGDEDPGTHPDPAPMQLPVTAVDTGTHTRYDRDASGALIPRTVRVILIAAARATPKMGDRIVMIDGMHEISRVERVRPGDTALLFEVELAI